MSNLEEIAAEMRETILAQSPGHYVMRLLAGGLTVLIHKRADDYRFAIGRAEARPSDTEWRVIAKAFGIPQDTEPDRRLEPIYDNMGRPSVWKIAETIIAAADYEEAGQ